MRIVVKIGTGTLSEGSDRLCRPHIMELVRVCTLLSILVIHSILVWASHPIESFNIHISI